MNNTLDVMTCCMACLTVDLGVVEAEQFISYYHPGKFDYMKW